MKLFLTDRPNTLWPDSAAEAAVTPEVTPAGILPLRLIADSGINRNDRPAFLPDFAREGWVLDIMPAVRIGRLGKFISPKFAARHISEFMLVGVLRDPSSRTPDPLTDSFDGVATQGNPLEYASLPPVITISAEAIGPDGHVTRRDLTLDISTLHIPETVALISRYSTLKSGDIIIPASTGLQFPAMIDTAITTRISLSATPVDNLHPEHEKSPRPTADGYLALRIK